MKSISIKTSIIVLVIMLFTACNIKIKPNVVHPDDYLSEKEHSKEIYKKNVSTMWINPFNFSHTDFGKLILVSIDNHPKIKTVELVVQNNDKGAFVVVYYHNGMVETYPNPNLSINRKYLKPNKDWKIMPERDFEFVLDNTSKGINFKLKVSIRENTKISISIKENSSQTKQYSFLAAIGADLSEVKRFPLIYLRKAGFVPVEKTKTSFKVNDIEMELTKVPIDVENQSCYKTVFSFSPQAFFWNEERDTILNLTTTYDKHNLQSTNLEYLPTLNNGHTEIKAIVYKTEKHNVKYTFSPVFPDINALKNGMDVKGKFTINVDEIEGVIGGSYKIEKNNDKIIIYIEPEKCWQPMPGKDWVSAYHYKAIINPISKEKYSIKSEWTIN